MTSKDIIISVGDVLKSDATFFSYIGNKSNRCLLKGSMKYNSVMPFVTLWIDDNGVIGNLPAGVYTFEIGLWNSIDKENTLTTLMDMKDRIKVLVNKQPGTINAQGHNTKVRTFDLVSAVRSDEYVGDKKLWFLPCIFDCIIGD